MTISEKQAQKYGLLQGLKLSPSVFLKVLKI